MLKNNLNVKHKKIFREIVNNIYDTRTVYNFINKIIVS